MQMLLFYCDIVIILKSKEDFETMKKYKGILVLRDNEFYLKNIKTNRLVKLPYYCKGAKDGVYKGEFSYNTHLKEWTFKSWENSYHEVNEGDMIEIYK